MPKPKMPIKKSKARNKPVFFNKGIATNVAIKGQRIGLRAQRWGLDITKEIGANVRTRTVGPKKKKTVYV